MYPTFSPAPALRTPPYFDAQYECYDEFFAGDSFTEDGASDFQDDCLDCESEDYTHYR